MTYLEFLESLALRHFRPDEFLIGLDRGNTEPPEHLWGNIVLPALVWDEIREALGPVILTSTYRSPEYNSQVGGSTLSQHMANAAIDGRCITTAAPIVAAVARSMRGRLLEAPIKVNRVLT